MTKHAVPLAEAARDGEIELDIEETEVFMNAQQWLREQQKRSEEAGREAGIVTYTQRVMSLRLRRELTPRERDALATLVANGREDDLAHAVAELDADALAAWLEAHAS